MSLGSLVHLSNFTAPLQVSKKYKPTEKKIKQISRNPKRYPKRYISRLDLMMMLLFLLLSLLFEQTFNTWSERFSWQATTTQFPVAPSCPSSGRQWNYEWCDTFAIEMFSQSRASWHAPAISYLLYLHRLRDSRLETGNNTKLLVAFFFLLAGWFFFCFCFVFIAGSWDDVVALTMACSCCRVCVISAGNERSRAIICRRLWGRENVVPVWPAVPQSLLLSQLLLLHMLHIIFQNHSNTC